MLDVSVRRGVARLALGFPPVNALSTACVQAIGDAVDDLEGREDWSVLHISSTLKTFSAGGDLEAIARWQATDDPGKPIAEYVTGVQEVFARIQRLRRITLVEIAGTAFGGGLELALACDLRAAARSAKLGLPETGVGLLPGAGGTQRLTMLCGPATALRLIVGAEVIDGATAAELGIVQWVFDSGELSEKVNAIAEHIASLPREAVMRAKACIAAALDPARDGFAEEIEATRFLSCHAEARTRIAAFLARSK